MGAFWGIFLSHCCEKMGSYFAKNIPSGTDVCFHGFLWSSPSACLPVCLRPGGRGGRKQIGGQVEGFPLFGCAAACGRGIQHKKYWFLFQKKINGEGLDPTLRFQFRRETKKKE